MVKLVNILQESLATALATTNCIYLQILFRESYMKSILWSFILFAHYWYAGNSAVVAGYSSCLVILHDQDCLTWMANLGSLRPWRVLLAVGAFYHEGKQTVWTIPGSMPGSMQFVKLHHNCIVSSPLVCKALPITNLSYMCPWNLTHDTEVVDLDEVWDFCLQYSKMSYIYI